ncbi:MAG TPA: hypothetical protein PK239_16955, partial [Chitinophagales bacterium]|nr:hypothetical protein [Chitinophagales bacterium]HRK28965.1 hypothetical protein [Chitinophagales bacterium]
VTDANGCSEEATFTINEPGCALSLNISATDALCNGDATGTIDLTITGAQGAVSILWNDGATTEDRTGLVAGTYSVTVTDAGNCSATTSVTVDEPAVLGMTGTVNDVTISGGSDGSIDVTVTGGTLPYTYLWSDGATTEDRTNLPSGTYTVTVTDANGCSEEATFTINEPDAIYDLALIKQLSTGQPAVVSVGSLVSFTITIFNQGSADAYNIAITDYIPSGMVLADADWTDNGNGTASYLVS